MTNRAGTGYLYYIRYAEEVFREGKVVAQPSAFVDFAHRLTDSLRSEFASARGKYAVDNPEEYERLEGGW